MTHASMITGAISGAIAAILATGGSRAFELFFGFNQPMTAVVIWILAFFALFKLGAWITWRLCHYTERRT